ncbi:hypothetical protein LIER_12805 [Lithospermum erythrorhizon]|uniref:Uncharacterized protein n=1 Tax=Lithospermum erythrorhizon TaxID=34254 RepID=A0AAV3PT78_LITER
MTRRNLAETKCGQTMHTIENGREKVLELSEERETFISSSHSNGCSHSRGQSTKSNIASPLFAPPLQATALVPEAMMTGGASEDFPILDFDSGIFACRTFDDSIAIYILEEEKRACSPSQCDVFCG